MRERLLVLVALVLLVLNSGAAAQTEDRFSPERIDAILKSGECTDRTVTLSTGAAPIPSLDVALVMDVTGSMSDEIAAVQQRATEIVGRVKALVPETRFAVATLADYPYVESSGGLLDMLGNLVEYGDVGDYPWRVESDFTADAGKIQTALNGIALLSGGDGPESYLRALSESRGLGWRAEARRIVILFGDSYPHDPDPGPDAKMGTADDLTQAIVVKSLQDAGVSVIGIYSTEELADFYKSLAAETGGQWFALTAAQQAPDAVVNLLETDVRTLRQVTLRPDAAYAPWVTWSPEVYPEVGGDTTVSWAVRICRPDDSAGGEHRFELALTASGARLYGIPVTIRSAPGLPAWLPWLGLIPLVGLLAFLLWRVTHRAKSPPRRAGVGPARSARPSAPTRWGGIPEKRPRPGGKDITPDR